MTKHKAADSTQDATSVTRPSTIQSASAPGPRAGSKAEALIGLLAREEGATIAQLSTASGWLPHSVRGFLAGTLKKRYRLELASNQQDGTLVYKLVNAPSQ